MGDLVPFPQRDEEYPWGGLKDILECQVKKLSDGLPESAPATITARMRPDVLRWIDHTGGIVPGIGALERARLVTFLSEVIVDRLLSEVARERDRV